MHFGELAHLARALAWQARGGRFESDILHRQNRKQLFTIFVFSMPYVKIFQLGDGSNLLNVLPFLGLFHVFPKG